MTDQLAPVHGCTIDGRPAMLILVTEHNELVARAAGAQPEIDRLTAELADYDERAEQQDQRADRAEAQLTAIRRLHRPVGVVAAAEFGEAPDCAACRRAWPCQTYNAVTEEPAIAQPEPWLHIAFTSPHETTANTSALNLADHLAAEFPGVSMRITTNAVEAESLTAVEEARLAQSGIDTPGCDCGHDGMGVSWHGDECPWRRDVLDGVTPAEPALREQLHAAIESELYEYRERTMWWPEGGITGEIARLATRGAMEVLSRQPAAEQLARTTVETPAGA